MVSAKLFISVFLSAAGLVYLLVINNHTARYVYFPSLLLLILIAGIAMQFWGHHADKA